MTHQFTTFDEAREHVVATMTRPLTGESIDRMAESLLSPALHPIAAPVPTRADAAAAAAAVRDHDATIAAIDADLATLQGQRAALDRKAASHNADMPLPPCPDASLVDAIVADPGAALDTDAVAAAIEQTRQARIAVDAWSTNRSLVQAAIDRIERQVAAIQARANKARADRDGLLRTFAKVASAHLIGRLEAALSDVTTDILNPLLALGRMEDSERKKLLEHRDVHVGRNCYVEVKAWDDRSYCRERVLLDARDDAAVALDTEAVIEQLSESLLQDTPE